MDVPRQLKSCAIWIQLILTPAKDHTQYISFDSLSAQLSRLEVRVLHLDGKTSECNTIQHGRLISCLHGLPFPGELESGEFGQLESPSHSELRFKSLLLFDGPDMAGASATAKHQGWGSVKGKPTSKRT